MNEESSSIFLTHFEYQKNFSIVFHFFLVHIVSTMLISIDILAFYIHIDTR